MIDVYLNIGGVRNVIRCENSRVRNVTQRQHVSTPTPADPGPCAKCGCPFHVHIVVTNPIVSPPWAGDHGFGCEDCGDDCLDYVWPEVEAPDLRRSLLPTRFVPADAVESWNRVEQPRPRVL